MDDDADDSQSFFAYSSDDMLHSTVVTAAGNTGESTSATGFASSQVSDTAIPNFLLKLWKLVEDERYKHCIEWDSTGFSFQIREPYGFSKDVLPLYFKHSNLNSFIRQLNMYGFRKVTSLEKGALKQQVEQETLEFQHPYFVRGHPELLQYIKRKISNPRAGGELDLHQQSSNARGLNHMLEELRQLRDKQFSMDARLNHMKKENGTLWREVAHMRQLHMKQQQVVNKLIQFLLSLVQPATGKRLGKRQLLAIGPGLLAEQQHDRDEQPGKRLRSESAVSSSSSAVQIIEDLEQELQSCGRLAYVAPGSVRRSVSGGPVIADVTDELEPFEGTPATLVVHPTESSTITGPSSSGMADTEGYSGASGGPFVQPTSSARPMDNLAFDVLPSVGLEGYKEPKAPGFANQRPAETGRLEEQPASSGMPQQEQQGQSILARPAFNRSFSDCNGSILPQAVHSCADWTVRHQQGNDGDQGKCSKPEFSEYLDFVQTDLDSLRDFLSTGSLNMDQDSLSSLFKMADESNSLSTTAPQPSSTEITGNEMQMYKRPELLVNVEGAGGTSQGYKSFSNTSNPTNVGPVTKNAAPSASMVNPVPIGGPPTSHRRLPWSRQQQQPQPRRNIAPASNRPTEQFMTGPVMSGRSGTSRAPTTSALPPSFNTALSQPTYVVSSGKLGFPTDDTSHNQSTSK